MTTPSLVPLAGSQRSLLPGAAPAGPVDPGERIELTVITRRAASLPRDAAGVPLRLSRPELWNYYGSDPADQSLVSEVLTSREPELEVTTVDPVTRRLKIAGPAAALARAFGTELSLAVTTDPQGQPVTHRYRTGDLLIPAELDGVIVAVLGLDNRPQASPHILRATPEAVQVSYTPAQVAQIYQYPAGTDGSGEKVAIIELGGGFSQTDLDTYFGGLGIPVPSVSAVGVDGASNVPGKDPQGADGEVLLDIEVVGAIAPGAAQLVYFAPNTDQGFVDAVTDAVHAEPTPAAVSISWGGAESSWTAQAMTALDGAIADGVALGVTVTVASGDNGSSDGVSDGQSHVDFPASSPHALACGGTSLQADVATSTVTSETVWNDGSGGGASGGGVSVTFGPPSWQATAGVPANPAGKPGRGVPDVAGNADPATGYHVLVDGQQGVYGGTSAVAPLWAALTARLVQSGLKPLGLLQQAIYAGIEPGTPVVGLRDITTGNNGSYSAGPGWDPCTGLGVPIGTALRARLAGAGAAGSTVSGATVSGGTISGATVSGGTVSGATVSGGTVSGATVSGTTETGGAQSP